MEAAINIRQIMIGVTALGLGILFYCFYRSPDHTYFLRFLGGNQHTQQLTPPVFAAFANSLPTFIHAFAFSLITAGLVARRQKGYLAVCLAWFAIDVFFEIGQGVSGIIVPLIPDWFSGFVFLENMKDYFLHGHFDYLDILSIALGSAAAYSILIITAKNAGEHNGRQIP